MRILSLLHIYFVLLDTQAIVDLPEPENMTLVSDNFDHVLHWSPGVGTPPGTVYSVTVRQSNDSRQKKKLEKLNSTTVNVSNYMRAIKLQYILHLWASHSNRSSPIVKTHFTPFTTTIIGPPFVTLVGCGDCLNISISLPKGKAAEESNDFYGSIMFSIQWRKGGDEKINTLGIRNSPTQQHHKTSSIYQYELLNLQHGVNYCVRAKPHLNVNLNTRISDWVCALTSAVDQRGVASLASWTAGFVLVGLGLLITIVGLVYTGFLCKLKISLPKCLTATVPSSYLLPEKTRLSVAYVECHKPKHLHQTEDCRCGKEDKENTDCRQNHDDDDDDENNEENDCVYMYRAIDESDSSATNSGQSSTSTAITLCKGSENSGGCSTKAEQTALSDLKLSQLRHNMLTDKSQVTLSELRVEKTNAPRLKKAETAGGQIHMAVGETFTNISLLSVTLKSLQPEEQEQVDEVSDSKELGRPLLEDRPCLSKPQTGKPPLVELQTHFQFQRSSQTDIPLKLKDFSETRMDQTIQLDRTHKDKMNAENDCLIKEEEEEEEEEGEDFSGYMGR